MKKLLFTTLMALLAFTGHAQTQIEIDNFWTKSNGSLIIEKPKKVTIDGANNEIAITVEYELDSIRHKETFCPGFSPVRYTKINSIGISNDSTVFANADYVKFDCTEESYVITVVKEGSGGYTYQIIQKGNKGDVLSVSTETNTNWDFDIPFLSDKKEKEENSSHPFRSHSDITCNPTFGMGLVSATAQGEGVDLSFSNGSFEFILDELIGVDYHMTRRQHFDIDFGLNWRNYRMTGDKRFVKENNGVVIGEYPDGANIKFSRIKIFSLTLSLMYKYEFGKDYAFGVGPVVCFNTGGNIKTRWSVDGQPDKDRQYNIRQNPVTVDFKAMIYADMFSFYFKYSPCNVMMNGHGPEFRSMSAGIMFDF